MPPAEAAKLVAYYPMVAFMADLTRLQRKILRLLGMPKAYSG